MVHRLRPPAAIEPPAQRDAQRDRADPPINNPGLKPQYAKEWDVALEYYFEPVGLLSVAWFHKDIRDYLVNGIDGGRVATGAGNGFNGDYAATRFFRRTTPVPRSPTAGNFPTSSSFTFLPGLLRTLAASANFTYLRAHGVFAGTTYLGTYQVAGFIPQTGNANLSWRYKAFGARVRANYHGRYINAFGGVTAPQRNQYRFSRTVTDLGFTWQLPRGMQLFLDVSNLTNEPQAFYRYIPSQMERTIINGTTWTMGSERALLTILPMNFVSRILVAALVLQAGLALRAAESEVLPRLAHNNPGLLTDLGVGLWAWPLPMDYTAIA